MWETSSGGVRGTPGSAGSLPVLCRKISPFAFQPFVGGCGHGLTGRVRSGEKKCLQKRDRRTSFIANQSWVPEFLRPTQDTSSVLGERFTAVGLLQVNMYFVRSTSGFLLHAVYSHFGEGCDPTKLARGPKASPRETLRRPATSVPDSACCWELQIC